MYQRTGYPVMGWRDVQELIRSGEIISDGSKRIVKVGNWAFILEKDKRGGNRFTVKTVLHWEWVARKLRKQERIV